MNELKIKRLLEDYQELHSDFQIEYFIIGSQGNAWAQYKQCLREIKGRLQSIAGDKAQAKILEIELKQKKFFWPSRLNREKNKLDKKSKELRISLIYDTIKERERELDKFVEIASRLKAKIGSTNTEIRRELEAEMWIDKGRKMIIMDRLMGGLRPQTIEYVLSLPNAGQFIVDLLNQDFDHIKLLKEFSKE